MTEPTIDDYVNLIRQWSTDRQIIANSTPLAQAEKTVEEVTELVVAAAQLKVYDTDDFVKYMSYRVQGNRQQSQAELADAIGDVFVTIVNVAFCAGLDPKACIGSAWNEIKDRKGYLGADGKFVKETT
jgi:NTP pyrophosphatase (non-canonical NTP hydrolase)